MHETLHCPAALNGFSSYPALASIRRVNQRTLQLANKTRHFKRIFAGCLGALLLSGGSGSAAADASV